MHIGFPNLTSTSAVKVLSHSESVTVYCNPCPVGKFVHGNYGDPGYTLQYPIVEGKRQPSPSGEYFKMEVEVIPQHAEIFKFYVKSAAKSYDGKIFGFPTENLTDSKDPQDEYVKIYSILVNEPAPEESIDEQTSEIPDWVRNIFIWYGEGTVSNDEIINAIKYLINQGIIQLD